MSEGYAMLCPTCGGLPVDYSDMERVKKENEGLKQVAAAATGRVVELLMVIGPLLDLAQNEARANPDAAISAQGVVDILSQAFERRHA